MDYIGKNRSSDLQILASLEKQSEHPLADAVVQKAIEEDIQLISVTDFVMREGK